jgi:predicted ATPase/DNA-binding XRE family transcriptional regulator
MVSEPGFGEWLSKQRKILGLTQKELAREINIAVITLRKIEAEQRKPSITIAQLIARFLAIPADQYNAFLRFARGEWQSLPALQSESVPWDSTGLPSPKNIPVHHTRLVGRDYEANTLLRQFENENARLVTLIGPPGVGKSRLAIEVMHSFDQKFHDGAYYVDLATVDSHEQLERYMLQILGFSKPPSENPLHSIEVRIATKQIFMVIDNAERFIENVAPLIDQMIQACPNLKICVTTREALHIEGEVLLTVSPLEFPTSQKVDSTDFETLLQYPAVKLFIESARVFQPDFSFNLNNIKDIAELCEYLDGLPLAIELLASRMRVMTPHSLIPRLDQQFLLRSHEQHVVPAYHSTLQDAIDRSYDFLKLDEKLLFSYLSIFCEEFTLEMVESAFTVTPSHNVIADILSSLLDKSLIQETYPENGEPHFTMLNIIRQYAAERLKDFEQHEVAPAQFSLDIPSYSKAHLAG